MFDIIELLRVSRTLDVLIEGHNGPITVMPLTAEQKETFALADDFYESLEFAAIHGITVDGVRAIDMEGHDEDTIRAIFHHESVPNTKELVQALGFEVIRLSGLQAPEEVEEVEEVDELTDQDLLDMDASGAYSDGTSAVI